jgi:hypothetical protein
MLTQLILFYYVRLFYVYHLSVEALITFHDLEERVALTVVIQDVQ